MTGDGTRERILAAAETVLARYGFHGATVREIVHQAGVNIAAINYHFGGKDALYEQALHLAVERMDTGCTILPDIPTDAGKARKLFLDFVQSAAEQGLSGGAHPPAEKLIGWEIMAPTGTMTKVLPMAIGPRLQRLASLIKAARGGKGDASENLWLAIWVFGQCKYFMRFGPIYAEWRQQPFDGQESRALAERLAVMTLGGLDRFPEATTAS